MDIRACRRIEAACPGVQASVQRCAPLYGQSYQRVRVWQRGTIGANGVDDTFAEVHVNLIGDASTVQDLIQALRACEYHRDELHRVENQFEEVEELIEAEERIRAMVAEIEQTRLELAERLVGKHYGYFHDAVREALPALAGN